MKCRKVQDRLAAYQADALHGLVRLRVAAHLRQCAACQRELAALERTVGLLRMAGGQQIPRDVAPAVMERVRREALPVHRPWRTRPLVLVPAALAAAALAVQISVRHPSGPPAGPDPTGAAYIREYAQFRADQEIGDSTGILLLAAELAEEPR